MANFFISENCLPLQWQKAFALPPKYIYTNNFNHQSGYFITPQVLKLLKKKFALEVTSQQKTKNATVNQVFLQPIGTKKYNVFTTQWNGFNEQFFKEITETILLPSIKQNITLYVPHGISHLLFDDSNFHIHLWGNITGKFIKNFTPSRMFNTLVCCNSDALAPSKKGVALIDVTTNYVVAEIYKRELFILHDICHTGKEEELVLYSIILNKLKYFLNNEV